MKESVKFLVFLSFFLFFPLNVLALAGLAESHSTLIYNDYAMLSWGHPSDSCPTYYTNGQYCFYIKEKSEVENPLDVGPLQRISIPSGGDQSIVLVQESRHGRWFVYDLESEGVLLEADTYDEALATWEAMGFPEPLLADDHNLSKFFEETPESRSENFEESMIFLGIFLFLISSISTQFLWLLGSLVGLLKFSGYVKNISLNYFFVYPQSLFFLLVLPTLMIDASWSTAWFYFLPFPLFPLWFFLGKKGKHISLRHVMFFYPSAMGFYLIMGSFYLS